MLLWPLTKGQRTFPLKIIIENTEVAGSIKAPSSFPISPLLLIGFQTNLVLTEGHSPRESNAVGFKKFGAELAKDVGKYRNCSTRTYLRILAPSLLGTPDLIAQP